MSLNLSDYSWFSQQRPENRGLWTLNQEKRGVWAEGPRVEVVPTLLTSSPMEIPSTYLWSPEG